MDLVKSLAILGIIFLPTGAFAGDIAKDGVPRYVETRMVPEYNSITPGQPLTFAITQKHAPGWHTYWKNPGDSGETTTIAWTMPHGFSPDEIFYPAPEREATGPLMNFGFGDDVTLLTAILPPKKISGDTIHLDAKVTWLVCSDICVPEMKVFSFDIPVVRNGDAATAIATDPDLFKSARAALPEERAWQSSIEEQDQTIIFKFLMDGDDAKMMGNATDITLFPEEWGIILNPAPQVANVTGHELSIRAERDTRPLSDLTTLRAVITFKDGDGHKKSASVAIPVTPVAMGENAKPMAAVATASSQMPPPSFLQAIFLALLGGLILNLMPCVFPVLSMKALSLVKMSDREQKHANIHGILYTLGILTCFAGIAGVLIALKSAGEEIGWGFQLQNPVVVLLLAYLLFAMALNLSGFFEIKGHLLANIGHKLTSHHGYSGTFFTGMLATIVATPCTAPFMATAMGYAATQPAVTALAIFMALGFGLALPYLLLCFIPPLRKSLPKPGHWMETFRQFLSFPLFASVAWLIWVYAKQVGGEHGTLLGLIGLLSIAFSIWVSRHEPRRQPLKTAIHALSLSSLLVAFIIAGLSHPISGQGGAYRNGQTTQQDDETTSIPHIAYSKSTLDELIEGDAPIFVDMTAAWCITCQVNERLAIYTDSTRALFKDKGINYVVGDWTNHNPEITEFLATYGRNGVPLYVFYGGRDSETGKRPEPKILPQLLTPGLVADVINGTE